MGSSPPELTPDQIYQKFDKELNAIESCRAVVAVDFSQSNFVRAKGWAALDSSGQGSLHGAGMVMHRDQTQYRVQSPYRRALELLSYRLFDMDKNQEGILFLGFADTLFVEQYVTRDTILAKYDELAACFNNGQIVQHGGTQIAGPIYRTIEHSVQKDDYTVLCILTDGDIDEVARATQAITDASNFPVSICTIGIGDVAQMEENFLEYRMFDEKLFERVFDNFHHFNEFHYFYKTNDTFYSSQYCSTTQRQSLGMREVPDDVQIRKEFDQGVFPEIKQQYDFVKKENNYKDVAAVLRGEAQ